MPPRFTRLAAAMAREVVPASPFAFRVARVPSMSRSRVSGEDGPGIGFVLTDSFIRSYDSSEASHGPASGRSTNGEAKWRGEVGGGLIPVGHDGLPGAPAGTAGV